jgi:hypothetical protein
MGALFLIDSCRFSRYFSGRHSSMAQSTEFRNSTLPQTQAGALGGGLERTWEKIKPAILRILFWAYERGTWQYDLIVLAILAFIFLSPRSWFNDRPTLELTGLRHQQGFVEMGHGKQGWRYLVDARLVESFPATKPEDAIQIILSRQLHQPFTVVSIVPITDKSRVVLGYTVLVSR